jgi:polyketide cyclase/dehydrase/lipid transport protein
VDARLRLASTSVPSIRKEIQIAAPPEKVWDALRDFGALHERLVPGFVTDCRMDGEDRIVTFANGATYREVLIDSDDDARRLAWSIVDEPYEHHNGVAQVFTEGDGCLFVWTTDLIADDEVVMLTDQSMETGVGVVKKTLEAAG